MRESLIVALMLVSAASAATVDSLAPLRALFPKPPAEFSTLPFLVWNGDMTEAMIDRELRDLSEQGVHGFIIHPRPGMITPYLSDRWFQLFRYTTDGAKKLRMEAWLYDENSYPSGFAGGRVPAEMPESYNRGQGLALLEKGPCAIELPRAEGGGSYCFGITQYAVRAWNGGYPYVDLLAPGVTQKFINVTMRGYEKTLGEDLGRTVPGIFTDEPTSILPGAE